MSWPREIQFISSPLCDPRDQDLDFSKSRGSDQFSSMSLESGLRGDLDLLRDSDLRILDRPIRLVHQIVTIQLLRPRPVHAICACTHHTYI